MAKIEFPQPPTPENPTTSPFTDQHGQQWVYNGKGWVRQAADPGIEEAPDDGQGYMRVNPAGATLGYWELAFADTWYLGPQATPPLNDGFGGSLHVGHIYYNTTDNNMYSWTGTSWVTFSPVLAVNTLAEYVWDSSPEIPADGSPTWPDDYGNNTFNWVNGEHFISVYLNGSRLINEYDPLKVAGDYVIDWVNDNIIIKNTAIPANARLVIQVGVVDNSQYISPDDNNASGWAFVIDEDDMISDLDTKVPTQQSVKAYTDARIMYVLEQVLLGGDGNDGILNTAQTIGEVFTFAGSTPPNGSIRCDGQLVAIADYPSLYTAIGDLWANTGGADNPPSDMFRLPPQYIDTGEGEFGLYARGLTPGDQPGVYLASSNKRHQHDSDHSHNVSISGNGSHSHTATTNKTGNHNHTVNGADNNQWVAGGTGGQVGGATAKTTSSNGSHSHTVTVPNGGGHSHTVTMTATSVITSNQGELEARPESITFMLCIWADLATSTTANAGTAISRVLG